MSVAEGTKCEFCQKKFPHYGTSLVPLGPTKWFCNEGHYKAWMKTQTLEKPKPMARIGV